MHEHDVREVLLGVFAAGGAGLAGRGGRRGLHHLARLQQAEEVGVGAGVLHQHHHVGDAHHQSQQLQGLHLHQVLSGAEKAIQLFKRGYIKY